MTEGRIACLVVAAAVLGGCTPGSRVVLAHCGGCEDPSNTAMVFAEDRYPDFRPSRSPGPGERRFYGYIRARRDSTALAAAQVHVTGTDIGVLTDEAGRYELFVPDSVDGSIQVDATGYRTELIPFPQASHRVDSQLGYCPICLVP